MITYDYACPHCGTTAEVRCKMSEREELWPSCPTHGRMEALITNNQRHTDNTLYRKGTGGRDWR
jgi:putative FmdB family regulatory protein